MELQIKDLVDSIRHDGIEEANKQSQAIINQANAKAQEIVEAARAQAKDLLDKANKELEVLTSNAKVSVKHAQRDAVLSFENEIKAKFQQLLSEKVRESFDDKALSTLIKAALSGEDVSAYAAELASVTESLKSELAKEIKAGLEIRPVKDVPYGFRLAAKDSSSFFDCSDEEIAKMLMPFFGELKV